MKAIFLLGVRSMYFQAVQIIKPTSSVEIPTNLGLSNDDATPQGRNFGRRGGSKESSVGRSPDDATVRLLQPNREAFQTTCIALPVL